MSKGIYLSPASYLFSKEFNLLSGSLNHNQVQNDIVGFEQGVKEFLETDKYCVALNSGTSALHLSLLLSGIQPGDYVLCQSHNFVATANVIKYCGALPIFVDSEKKTGNLSLDDLKCAIDDLKVKGIFPKAVIVSSLYGMPFQFDEIHAFVKSRGIKLIENSAESLGSSYKGQKCGCLLYTSPSPRDRG